MASLCLVLGGADPGNAAFQGTWLGLSGQSHFSGLPSRAGKTDFCHPKDKRPGLGLADITYRKMGMAKLEQGAGRRPWTVGYAVLLPSQKGEIAEVGAGTVVCTLPFQLLKLCCS